ncbi:aspartate aminotransferase family protein [bacterium]|nr:aspartate aminotransferase family protein [bacterium]
MNIYDNYDSYIMKTYTRVKPAFVKGEGSWLFDKDGNKYLDLFPGWGTGLLGHCHPKVVKAIKDQAEKLIHLPNNYYNELQPELAELVIKHSFPGKIFFCNSGAEAIEGSMKVARNWGKNQAKTKYKFITTTNSFHGRTFGALTATAQEKYQAPFTPLVPGFTYVPYNDISAMEQTIDDETVAVILEPVQGEGGVNIPTKEYMTKLRQLCTDRGCLLICDEVQTGVGRTGTWFGYQNFDITPDIMAVAKIAGSGAPIGMIVAKPEIADLMQPGYHGSTYGGNPLVCAASIATFKAIEEEFILEKAKDLKTKFDEKAKALKAKYPDKIKEYRGLGAIYGIELTKPGAPISAYCLENKVLCNCTHNVVLRFLPSALLTDEELTLAFKVIDEAISKL